MGRMKLSARVVAQKGKVGASLKHARANLKTKAKEQTTPKKRKTYSKKSKLSLSLDSNDNADDDKKSRSQDKVVQKKSDQKKKHRVQYKKDPPYESSEEEEETLTPLLKKVVNEYPCFACNEMFNKTKDLFDHTCKEKNKKGFMCKVCKKVISKRNVYLCHEITHSKEKRYKCGDCGKRYASKGQYITHMKREHPELELFVCHYVTCDCSFPTHKELMSHHKVIHNANQCKYCDKNFDTKSKLLLHKFNEHERFFKKK